MCCFAYAEYYTFQDFGLTRHMHQSDDEANNRASNGIYYGCVSEDIPLPMLTFAPELCRGGVIKFDGKTDVWAFGITLIELYQLGKPPYQNFQSTKCLF